MLGAIAVASAVGAESVELDYTKNDEWAVGWVAFEMMSGGRPPFPGPDGNGTPHAGPAPFIEAERERVDEAVFGRELARLVCEVRAHASHRFFSNGRRGGAGADVRGALCLHDRACSVSEARGGWTPRPPTCSCSRSSRTTTSTRKSTRCDVASQALRCSSCTRAGRTTSTSMY